MEPERDARHREASAQARESRVSGCSAVASPKGVGPASPRGVGPAVIPSKCGAANRDAAHEAEARVRGRGETCLSAFASTFAISSFAPGRPVTPLKCGAANSEGAADVAGAMAREKGERTCAGGESGCGKVCGGVRRCGEACEEV